MRSEEGGKSGSAQTGQAVNLRDPTTFKHNGPPPVDRTATEQGVQQVTFCTRTW